MTQLGAVVLAAGAALSMAAAWTDWRRREVPHWIVGGLVAGWLAVAGASPGVLGAPPLHGVVFAACALAAGFVTHAAGWVGAGDAKLLAALALWLGPAAAGFVLTACAGLLLLFVLAARTERGTVLRTRGIPVACALAPPAALVMATRAAQVLG